MRLEDGTKYDEITGEIIPDDIEVLMDELIEEDINKKPLVEAKKYLKLMEAFDVEAGNMEEELGRVGLINIDM